MSVRQAEQVAALLSSLSVPWNGAWQGSAAVTGPQPGVAALPGGLRITLLSPGHAELKRLGAHWVREHARPSPDESPDGLSVEMATDQTPAEPSEASDKEQAARPPAEEGRDIDVEALANSRFVGDSSIANASSIAFLAEFHDRALLVGGDALADVLTRAIRALIEQRRVARLRVDAFVVPHGGSARNTSRELLELLDCDRYLFSTDGEKFRHPARETVARILTYGRSAPQAPLTLVFNHRSQFSEIWANPALQQRYRYRAVYPEAAAGGVTVSLL